MNNFGSKLDSKLSTLLPRGAKLKLVGHHKSLERRLAPWIGSSVIASSGSFQNAWVSKALYEEEGDRVLGKMLG